MNRSCKLQRSVARPCPPYSVGPPTPAILAIASISAAGLATPLPAMSKALPCATDENRIGLPIANAAAWLGGLQLRRNMALVVQHDHEGIGALLVKHGVASERAGDVDAGLPRRRDGGRDDLDFLAPEQPALAGMGVEPADEDLRRRDTEAPQRRVGRPYGAADLVAGDQCERLARR